MIFSRSVDKLAALTGFASLALSGFAVPGVALADPYSLPIASYGPVKVEAGVSPETRSLQELAAQVGLATFTAADWHPGPVRHIVLITWKAAATAAQRTEVTARFLHLAQDSRRPNGAHVVQSIEMGMQNSGEGQAEGLQQAFVLNFRSEGDRNFYVGKPVVNDAAFFDPAHEAFKEFAAPYIERMVVFDFDVLAIASPVPAKKSRHG